MRPGEQWQYIEDTSMELGIQRERHGRRVGRISPEYGERK
jgi:hypothetical protein